MATANVISIIGTAVTVLTYALGKIPDGPDQAKTSYIIANDGANGDLSNAGGDLPDLRHFDETAEFIGATAKSILTCRSYCDEGYTTCTTDVNTQEAVSYTLFTANNDAICIAWTGVAWAGGQKKYSFHPGNWAYACNVSPYTSGGAWYYAGQVVPGIDYPDQVYCAWLDADGDLETTGISVHWPEFDADQSIQQDRDYYCTSNVPVEYHTEPDPSMILPAGRRTRRHGSLNGRQENNSTRMEKFAQDPRLIKSHFANHAATELCDHSLKAAGQSFVSYAEKKFCYMPTKTLYDFCEDVESGACWSDETNKVITKNGGNNVLSNVLSVPDLSHINNVIEWGT
ncbi:hypothetical protein TW65_05646 [Stemphylium lycopersici]|nr:hypothetical protein TW65_05646 [Stemphylium lycopersici]